jgi:hypothetical protein
MHLIFLGLDLIVFSIGYMWEFCDVKGKLIEKRKSLFPGILEQ